MREDPKLQMRNENWGPSEPSVHVLGVSCLEFKRCLLMNPLCTNGYMHGSFEQTASEHFLTLVTAVHSYFQGIVHSHPAAKIPNG